MVYGEGDAAVTGRVGMSYCDTSRFKIGCQWELNSVHSVETGLCMLGTERYTKGEQINRRVSVQAYSSRNSVY